MIAFDNKLVNMKQIKNMLEVKDLGQISYTSPFKAYDTNSVVKVYMCNNFVCIVGAVTSTVDTDILSYNPVEIGKVPSQAAPNSDVNTVVPTSGEATGLLRIEASGTIVLERLQYNGSFTAFKAGDWLIFNIMYIIAS